MVLTRADLKLPPGFNGVGIHYWPHQVKRDLDDIGKAQTCEYFRFMAELGITSITILDCDDYHYQLASEFGMLVLNRPFRRAYQPFTNDGDPVGTAIRNGHAPIVQLNNEDELSEEWDGQEVNWMVSARLLVDASCQVYDQGGIVCWQMLDFDYFRYCVQVARDSDAMRIFDRWLFCSHPYGINHPPNYIQDENAFLGFQFWHDVIKAELDLEALQIAGEMGWGLNEDKDNRFQKVTDELRTEYMMAVYDSFRTGVLPDGSPLPDYFLAANRWILGSTIAGGPLTWEDDALLKGNGTRIESLIAAMKAMPRFVRRFSDDEPSPDPQPSTDGTANGEEGTSLVPELQFAFADYAKAHPELGLAPDSPMTQVTPDDVVQRVKTAVGASGVLWWREGEGVTYFPKA